MRFPRAALVTLALGAVAALACGPRDEPVDRADAAPKHVPASTAPAPASAPASKTERPRIVMLGDSLTAGLGLATTEAYPALIQQRLNDRKLNYEVVNAGVSGDTSAGGLSRLDWALAGDVRILVVALGGNDALRGLPPKQLKQNLAHIIERAQGRGVDVVLAGMDAPPNWGRQYIVEFHQVYPELAKQYRVAFVPFLLQGVAGSAELNQPDGIHPTAKGARILADNVWAVLEPIAGTR